MSFIEWKSDFSVHHDRMDKQHQLLFDYVNEFYFALERKAENDELVTVYSKILSYTDFHFKDEERLMLENNYPDYEIHKNMHENLVNEALLFREKLVQQEQGVENNIKYFLKVWLSAHIKGIDKKYSNCVNFSKNT